MHPGRVQARLEEGVGGQDGGDGGTEEDPTMAAFKRAAQFLKEKREEEKLPAEERVFRCVHSAFPSCLFVPAPPLFFWVLSSSALTASMRC